MKTKSPSEIKQELSTFVTVQCGLYHEKVALNPETKMPIITQIDSEVACTRVQLCPANLRSKRLGCAHSFANDNFNKLINELESENSEITELQAKIKQIILKIYMLDHEKGNLEKDHAKSVMFHSSNKSQQENIQTKIEQCLAQHFILISELESTKNKILHHLA